MVAALAAVLAACGDGPSGPSHNGAPAARVVIIPDSVALPRGQTMGLEALVVDGAGSTLDGRDVHWRSSDTVRVKVTTTGVISASDVGWSMVSATSEGKADTVKVIVTTN
jgi:hypothetical protein